MFYHFEALRAGPKGWVLRQWGVPSKIVGLCQPEPVVPACVVVPGPL